MLDSGRNTAPQGIFRDTDRGGELVEKIRALQCDLLVRAGRSFAPSCSRSFFQVLFYRALPQIGWVDYRCRAEFIRPTTLPLEEICLV